MGTTAQALTLSVAFIVVTSIVDAFGFLFAADIWQAEGVDWSAVSKSALCFSLGMALYWLGLRFMTPLGCQAPELQTVASFALTLIGVAVFSGRFFTWAASDQGVALAVLAGLGWLLWRVGE